MIAEWYYVGTYGQLGPLQRDEIEDLILGGAIGRETFVWKAGMSEWVPAGAVPELAGVLADSLPLTPPPPPPITRAATSSAFSTYPAPTSPYPVSAVRSDKSRIAAGILQFIPGVGRLYLGYGAIGILQLILFLCGGVGWIWSVIDGILILTGAIKHDGYGRTLDP
jgi:hypothetical protein